MISIKIDNHIASIINNETGIYNDCSKCIKMINILNEHILPNIHYNSNIIYGINYCSNVMSDTYYGWYDIPSTNSNMVLIPNIEYNTIDISSKDYFSAWIDMPPPFEEYILPDIYTPILNKYTEDVTDIIKQIIYCFNYKLLPVSYIPHEPYFKVSVDNNIVLYSKASGNELETQQNIINALKDIAMNIWKNINLEGYYTFSLPSTIHISDDTIIQYIKKILVDYLDKLNVTIY